MAECDNNVPDYIVLPSQGVGTPGPEGPIGPQGPPGDVSAVPAENVTVTNPGYNNAQEIFDFLLYIPLEITSFVPATSVYEIGTTIVSLGFTWTLSKSEIISQALTGVHLPIVLGIVERGATVNFSPALGVSSTFTLTVDDNTTVAVSTANINFYNGIYYGNSPLPISINSNFINSLTKNLQAGREFDFISNAGVDEYVWYAHKKSLGVANFVAGGFTGGFEAPSTVSFTNASVYTEDYYVYRSTNPQIGVISIVVS